MPQKATRKAEIEYPLYSTTTVKKHTMQLRLSEAQKEHKEALRQKFDNQSQLKGKDPSKQPRKPISSSEGLYLRHKGEPEIKKTL